MGDKIRHQHYVWRHYLRSWANEKDIIYCLRDNKIFTPNLMGIAQKRDFYRLQELNEDDLFWLNKIFIDKSPEPLRVMHKQLINMFNAPFNAISELKRKGLTGDEFNKQSDIIINNTQEKFHGQIESEAIPIIEKLRNKDTTFFNNEDKRFAFLNYLTTQYFRTNNFRTKIISQFTGNKELKARIPEELTSKKINIEKMWNLIMHILAANTSFNMIPSEYQIILIENKTKLSFITCDQPIINTYAVGQSPFTIPNELDFYYPITPKIAVWLTDKHNLSNSRIEIENEKLIDGYNRGIINQSLEQLYSDNKSTLEKYLNIS